MDASLHLLIGPQAGGSGGSLVSWAFRVLQEVRKSPGQDSGELGPLVAATSLPGSWGSVSVSDKRRVAGLGVSGTPLASNALQVSSSSRYSCFITFPCFSCRVLSRQFPAFLSEEREGNFSLEPDLDERGRGLDNRWPEPTP